MNSTQDTINRVERFLDLHNVAERICLSKSWVYAAIKRGEFPRPIRVGGRLMRWTESEINKWIEAQTAVQHKTEEI